MTICIWGGGQTGVDRGAAIAALAMGFEIGGYLPSDDHDELGFVPETLIVEGKPVAYRRRFKRCLRPGLAARTRINVETAHALLVIVRDHMQPWETPGTKLTLDERRIAKPSMPWKVAAPEFSPETIAGWVMGIDWERKARGLRETRLMVAGPRASRWADGEREAERFVRAILEAARG